MNWTIVDLSTNTTIATQMMGETQCITSYQLYVSLLNITQISVYQVNVEYHQFGGSSIVNDISNFTLQPSSAYYQNTYASGNLLKCKSCKSTNAQRIHGECYD